MMNNLQVQFPQSDKEDNKIILVGDFNMIDAMHFKVHLLNHINKNNRDCILDIKAVTKMDLTALNALIIAQKEILQQGKTLTIEAERDNPIMDLLHLTKFERHLNINVVAH